LCQQHQPISSILEALCLYFIQFLSGKKISDFFPKVFPIAAVIVSKNQ
jgi:hypothetical protein